MKIKVISLVLISCLVVGCFWFMNRNEVSANLLVEQSISWTLRKNGVICGANDDQPGVKMLVQFPEYNESVYKINVLWQNNSDSPVSFGEPYNIEVFVDGNWERLDMKPNVAFNMPAYPIEPGCSREHTYNLSIFTNELTEGKYRIVTEYDDSGDKLNKGAVAEFVIKK